MLGTDSYFLSTLGGAVTFSAVLTASARVLSFVRVFFSAITLAIGLFVFDSSVTETDFYSPII